MKKLHSMYINIIEKDGEASTEAVDFNRMKEVVTYAQKLLKNGNVITSMYQVR